MKSVRLMTLAILALCMVAEPRVVSAGIDWVGNVSPCPNSGDGYLVVFDNAPLEVFVDVFSWGSCPDGSCPGGTRLPGPLGGVTASLRLVPVATNQGGETIPMQYVGDFAEYMPVTLTLDTVDRYRALVSVEVLRRNSEVYYRAAATDRFGTIYPYNTCGTDGRLLKLRIRHDVPVTANPLLWGAIKQIYR
jgi:hypothetical protein